MPTVNGLEAARKLLREAMDNGKALAAAGTQHPKVRAEQPLRPPHRIARLGDSPAGAELKIYTEDKAQRTFRSPPAGEPNRQRRLGGGTQTEQQPETSKIIHLESPPYAACHAGVNYYRAMLDQLQREFPHIQIHFTLCCGDNPAIAHDALRMGFTSIRLRCSDGIAEQLNAMASSVGATLVY